jgi:hypothetical protein
MNVASVWRRAHLPKENEQTRAAGALTNLRSEQGQSLVEFALVILPLAVVVMGIIDFGSIYSNVIGVRQGVADGARQASVGQFGSISNCPLSGVSGPMPGITQIKEIMCTVHASDGINDDGSTRVSVIVGDSTGAQNYAVGTPITVCEMYAVHSLTGMLSPLLKGHFATSVVTERIETINVPNPLPNHQQVSENAISGSSWSFCTAPAPYT